MIYRLASRSRTPPGGFNVAVAETGYQVSAAPVFETARMMLERHLMANGLPTDDAALMIDRQTAARLVEEGHDRPEWVEAIPVQTKGRRSVLDYLRGTRSSITARLFKIRGKPLLAPRKQAIWRAEVCIGCPKNLPPAEAGLARVVRDFTDGLMAQIVEGRTTPHDSKLKACAVCSCLIGTKIHFSQQFLQETTDRSLYRELPAHCWIVTELEGKKLAASTPHQKQHLVTGTALVNGSSGRRLAQSSKGGGGCATCGRG